MESSTYLEKLLKKLCPVVFLVSISAPVFYFFDLPAPHMLLQSVLLNPSMGPYKSLPSGNEDLYPTWEIKTASGSICKIPFRRMLGKLNGPSRYHLPFYFAENDFWNREELNASALAEAKYYRGSAQAINIETYWVCHLSGCAKPVSVSLNGQTWEVQCDNI